MIQRRKKRCWKKWAVGLLAGAALVNPAVADPNNALVEALIRKGVLTEKEAKEITAELNKEQQRRVFARPSSDNIKDLQIRGRIQGQFGYTYAENNAGSDDYSTFEMRRVRLGLRGPLYQNFRAQMEANLVPNSFSMRSAYIEWREYKPAYVRLGLEKSDFGLEETTSSAAILTVERSNVNNQLWRSPGAQMTGLSFSGTAGIFSYGAGIYTGRPNVNPNGMDRYLYNGSVEISLDQWMPENQKLRFRVDGIVNDDTGAQFVYEDGIAASGHYVWGPFDVRAEFIQASAFGGGDIRGGYIMPSYYFTEKVQGVLRYERSSAKGVTIGAPSRYVARTDVTPTGASRSGTDFQAIYGGANYYLRSDHLKLMGGLEYSGLENTPRGTLSALTLLGAVRMLF